MLNLRTEATTAGEMIGKRRNIEDRGIMKSPNWQCASTNTEERVITYTQKRRINVKAKSFWASSLLALGALFCVGYMPAQSGGPGKITVLNPAIASKMAKRAPLCPRLNTLEGKTLYLVDINWGGPDAAYSVYEEMQDWFAKEIPSLKIVIKRKKGPYSQDDPELWKEIAKNGNAAMVGISG
jgi:hypothetical protein